MVGVPLMIPVVLSSCRPGGRGPLVSGAKVSGVLWPPGRKSQREGHVFTVNAAGQVAVNLSDEMTIEKCTSLFAAWSFVSRCQSLGR